MRRFSFSKTARMLAPAAALLAFVLLLDGCHLMVSEFRAKIVYTCNASGTVEIYTMRANGGGQTRITNPDFGKSFPVWSPDGTKIAYASNSQIWIMNWDGSDQRALTASTVATGPVWSPDGNKIAYIYNNDIYVRNIDGSNETAISSGGSCSRPQWSPDGERIAYLQYSSINGQYHLYVNHTDLTSSIDSIFADGGSSISWSPDGKKIAYSSSSLQQITVMNSDGSNPTDINGNAENFIDIDPIWSPNGKLIAFLRGPSDSTDLCIMNADGSNTRYLTTDSLGHYRQQWSPDGLIIIFESAIGIYTQICRVNTDGSNPKQLTSGDNNKNYCMCTFH